MSNILNHNRLPLECKLSYKDYWDFCLRIGRECYGFTKGMQTECLSAFIDTNNRSCWDVDNLISLSTFEYDKAVANPTTLSNFGLTNMDNGRIVFDKDIITNEDFEELLESEFTYPYFENSKKLILFPINGNNKIYTYSCSKYKNVSNSQVYLKLNGGFYQGIFRIGDGCNYSVLPSDIGNGLSLEFELYKKEFESEGYTLNDASDGKNKGIFFYIGTRAENKWARYYYDKCSENSTQPETTDLETSDGVQLDDYIPDFMESDNKFLIYSRVCGGTTVLNDTGDETVLVESSPVEYDDNLFTVFSRKCGGITVNNFEENYLKKHPSNKYNIYADLWNNALAFRITDDNRVGYKYLVKDCEAENPSCSYKIESEYSYPDTVPYSEWTTIHVRILPSGVNGMRLLFYVDGRLVLFSKELPKLNLRELKDLSEKQECVPFNISLGGGTQGLCDVVYEDYKTFYETDYPLQKEFAGTFIGYLKAFRFYSCSLNYSQIRQNVNNVMSLTNEDKIYCGAIVFNTKPSRTPVNEQINIIKMLNEYHQDVENVTIHLLPDITKRYMRLVLAIPVYVERSLHKAVDLMSGLGESSSELDKPEITNMFTSETVAMDGVDYNVWYYTYATHPQYNNTIEIQIK